MTLTFVEKKENLKMELQEIESKIDEKKGDINKLSKKKDFIVKKLKNLEEIEMDFKHHLNLVACLNGV